MVIPLCAMDCYCMAHLVRRFVYKMVRVYVANWCKLLVVSFITGHTPSAGNCWVYFQKKRDASNFEESGKNRKYFRFHPSLSFWGTFVHPTADIRFNTLPENYQQIRMKAKAVAFTLTERSIMMILCSMCIRMYIFLCLNCGKENGRIRMWFGP